MVVVASIPTHPANDSQFEPLAVSDPAFLAWAVRVGLRLRNTAHGAPVSAIERAVLSEGTHSPEWAQALAFMISLAQENKINSMSA